MHCRIKKIFVLICSKHNCTWYDLITYRILDVEKCRVYLSPCINLYNYESTSMLYPQLSSSFQRVTLAPASRRRLSWNPLWAGHPIYFSSTWEYQSSLHSLFISTITCFNSSHGVFQLKVHLHNGDSTVANIFTLAIKANFCFSLKLHRLAI